MRLLVVEDNPVTADLLVLALPGEGGHRVDAASCVREALRGLHDRRPDAVLLDLLLPGMSGLEFLRALPRDAVPVVLFTAASEQEVARVLAEFPGLLVLRKPADVPEILAALDRACDLSRRQAGRGCD